MRRYQPFTFPVFSVAALLGLTAGWIATPPQASAAHHGNAASHATDHSLAEQAVRNYANLVHTNYRDALKDAQAMSKAIDAFLAKPTGASLKQAKKAWLVARESYGQTEVFRFYGGPIDGVGPSIGLGADEEGPEGQINAWPLNEAFIDSVKGKPNAGIVNDKSVALTTDALIQRNAITDEADVTTGYHAIEFLLWGQDFSTDGPGTRPFTDYATDGSGDGAAERRGQYLKLTTDLLVSDLQWLTKAWDPHQSGNFRTAFLAQPAEQSLGQIMTGMATLAGFELASERMAVALESGDQEDEHSCFSDNTHRDFVTNIQGIQNVLTGQYGYIKGTGVDAAIAAKDPKLAGELQASIAQAVTAAESLPVPIDNALASAPGSEERKAIQALIDDLYTHAELLLKAGETLGVEVIVAGE